MLSALTWPGKYFFYPIGNTSAVCLTRDLAPEKQANILLLGCGDPRHVLFTIYNEPVDGSRSLDFTCCDFDPAVLARNILLFTMLIDNQYSQQIIWNIFFHMYLDKEADDALFEQCSKLCSLSESIGAWKSSPYDDFLNISTTHTLSQLHRHWTLYTSMRSLPPNRKNELKVSFKKMKEFALQHDHNISPARSAGPLMIEASKLFPEQFRRYWESGTTFLSPNAIANATLLNPTFVYSRGGEGCCVHYGTDALVPFHFAEVFANNPSGKVTLKMLVQSAQKQFEEWCSAYRSLLPSKLVAIRFIAGDAVGVCEAFDKFRKTGVWRTEVPASQWGTSRIEFDTDYSSGVAPTVFDVIETSNLEDHIGLLTVLVASIPVRAEKGVIYSEGLLPGSSDNITKEFTNRLYADIPVMGLLLGVCPVDYLSSFNSRSNTHELMLVHGNRQASQFHQVTTWKVPDSGDPRVASGSRVLPHFEPTQLGTLLWDLYHELFEQEDSSTFHRKVMEKKKKSTSQHMLYASNIRHYTRETFIYLLKLVRRRLLISDNEWHTTMQRFITIMLSDTTMPMDTVNRQEFITLLHYHGVYTMDLIYIHYGSHPFHSPGQRKVGRFARWPDVPPIVRIVFSVPREKLRVLGMPAPLDPHASNRLTIPLLCWVRGKITFNVFTASHVAFGRAILTGTPSRPRVTFEEDNEGWLGSTPLVASFVMPTQLLVEHEPQSQLSVHLGVPSTAAALHLVSALGLELSLFSAPFLDEQSVQVLPEYPLQPFTNGGTDVSLEIDGRIGRFGNPTVDLDEECELVSTLTSRIDLYDKSAQKEFGIDRVTPNVQQVSPCVLQIELGNRKQDISFPFPVAGEQHRLRLARKSMYIEIVVPISQPFKLEGMNRNPFPVVGQPHALTGWNIHRVNLHRLPICKANKPEGWFAGLVGSMMSARERAIRKKEKNDLLTAVKDSLITLLMQSCEKQANTFALRDRASDNCDTILLVDKLKLDVQAHTVVGDAYVLPLTRALITANQHAFGKLVSTSGMLTIPTDAGEMTAWKHLLPAFVERCRTWHHQPNCEYESSGRIPISDAMENIPLCNCGRGKDVDRLKSLDAWRPFARHSYRLALSPLFAVSYLERIGRAKDPALRRCHVCRRRPEADKNMMTCSGCKKTRYCSRECQKSDWKKHKESCKT